MNKFRGRSFVVLLFFSAILFSRGEDVPVQKVKSISLKRIDKDLNGKIYSWTFVTDAGHGLEIRSAGSEKRLLLMTSTYDLKKLDHLHSPWVSETIPINSPKGTALMGLLKLSSEKLPKGDSRIELLNYLVRRMEGQFLDQPTIHDLAEIFRD